jgi:hypothetical protein
LIDVFDVLNDKQCNLAHFSPTSFPGLYNVEKNSVSGCSQLEQLATLVVEKMEIFLKQEGIKM